MIKCFEQLSDLEKGMKGNDEEPERIRGLHVTRVEVLIYCSSSSKVGMDSTMHRVTNGSIEFDLHSMGARMRISTINGARW